MKESRWWQMVNYHRLKHFLVHLFAKTPMLKAIFTKKNKLQNDNFISGKRNCSLAYGKPGP